MLLFILLYRCGYDGTKRPDIFLVLYLSFRNGIQKKDVILLADASEKFSAPQNKYISFHKQKATIIIAALQCGEGGIRTLGTSLRTYDGLANR